MKKQLSKFLVFALILTLSIPVVPAKAAFSAKLNATKATITGVNSKYQLRLTAPAKSRAYWNSYDSSIAGITSRGVIVAKRKGSTTVTCTVKYGRSTRRLACNVTVKVPAAAVQFTNAIIDKDSYSHIIMMGSTYDFNRRLISSSTQSGTSDTVRYFVGDSSIASVNARTGLVTPIKEGITTLTVCAGSSERAALRANNRVSQTIRIRIVSPKVSVVSCNLNNSKEVAISFSHPMNASTLYDNNKILTDNINIIPRKVNNVSATDPGTLTGCLSADQKTLIITSTNPFKGTYKLTLDSNITSTSGSPLQSYNKTVVLEDKVGPTFIGSKTDESGLIASINFSEPISIKNLVATDAKKTNNTPLSSANIFNTASNYKLSADQKSLTIDLSNIASSDKGCEIQVKLAGITDLVGNTTEPYPAIVKVFTDTSQKPQATCKSVVRNGNSLIATFDRSIQTAGYAVVNGVYLTGSVNAANKTEVIYNLGGLTTLTGNVPVTLTGFSGYNTNYTQTQFTTNVFFSTNAALPSLAKSSFTTKNNKNVLILTYDKKVKVTNTTGTLSYVGNIDGVVGSAKNCSYTASAVDNEVTFILNDSFTNLANYSFSLPADLVRDYYNNSSALTNIALTKQTGDTSPLSAPTAIQVDSGNSGIVYVTFGQMLDVTSAQTVSNYRISGLSIGSAVVISNANNTPSIVKLTLAYGNSISDIPYQVTISGVKGYRDSNSVMNTYSDMVNFSSNKTLNVTAYNGTAWSKKIVLTFGSTINTSSSVNYTFTANGKTLNLKGSPVISGTTITFELADSINANTTVYMEPTIKNSITDTSNKKLLNQSYYVQMK